MKCWVQIGTIHESSCWCPKAKFLTSRHVRVFRVIFYVSNTLRKLMIRASDLVLRYVCRVRARKKK